MEKIKRPKKAKKRRKTPDGRGRPPHMPSIENAETVAQMKFCGESNRTIALALQIDEKTLVRHYAAALDGGVAIKRKQLIEVIWEAAKKGNVSAAKMLEDMGEIAAAADAVNKRGQAKSSAPVERPRPLPKLGKKEQQQVEADKVTGIFAPPAGPKLVINNGK